MVVVGLMKKIRSRRRVLRLLNSNRYKRYHALEGDDDDDEGCDSDGHDHDPSQQH